MSAQRQSVGIKMKGGSMNKKFVVSVDGIAVSDKFDNEGDAEIFVQRLEEEDGIQPESISIKNVDD
jgi:hypothetical protein